MYPIDFIANKRLDLCMFYNLLGGYIPKDAPDPDVQLSTVAEYIIVSLVASIGIISTLFFFIFNLCYSKHM